MTAGSTGVAEIYLGNPYLYYVEGSLFIAFFLKLDKLLARQSGQQGLST